MRRFLFLPFVLATFALLSTGCNSLTGNNDATSGAVQVEGQVLDAATNNPVPSAVVRIAPYNLIFEVDDQGKFSGSVDIDSTMDLHLTATSGGYADADVSVLAIAGRTLSVPPLKLVQTASAPPSSGLPANIIMVSQEDQNIGVRESGSKELTQITFQLADSVGRPVVLDHSTEVSFSFGAHPDGGEQLSPATAQTDNNGTVVVNLQSGTKAGVVQIIAQASVAGRTLRSTPVAVAIHGGLPVLERFTIAPERWNYPGMAVLGAEDLISAVVGDSYGNPVRPQTLVYFTTTGGIIEGSAATSSTGRGSVKLISGNPIPSNGIAVITASTADVNHNTISTQIPVVMSGPPQINLLPANVAIGQQYVLTVDDELGNPLVSGTDISISTDGDNILLTGTQAATLGETSIIHDPNGDGDLSDARAVTGLGRTQFIFGIEPGDERDEDGNLKPPVLHSLTISVGGDNGSLSYTFSGDGSLSVSKNSRTITNRESDGSITVRLQK